MSHYKFASLCVLAYKRPELLNRCLNSLRETADFPYELIVNLDGQNPENDRDNVGVLVSQYRLKQISKLILTSGDNRGVGRSFQNCLGLVEGDYVVKIDTDLTFKPNWLSKTVSILDKHDSIGAVSLFDYNHYDPNDDRFKPENCHEDLWEDCIVVKDFVSSIYAFRSADLNLNKPVKDDGYHIQLRETRGALAITKEDYVKNNGFGVIKSTYVSGTEDHPYKTPTYNEPLIFKSELSK